MSIGRDSGSRHGHEHNSGLGLGLGFRGAGVDVRSAIDADGPDYRKVEAYIVDISLSFSEKKAISKSISR